MEIATTISQESGKAQIVREGTSKQHFRPGRPLVSRMAASQQKTTAHLPRSLFTMRFSLPGIIGAVFLLSACAPESTLENISLNAESGLTTHSSNLQPSCSTFSVTAVAPAGSSYPAATTVPVVAGASYQITVSGTYFANDGLYADAKYSSRFGSTWSDLPQNYEIHGPTLLDLQIWDPSSSAYVSPNWGPYDSAHTYSIQWTATSSVLSLRINDFAASNNTGALFVTVCQSPPPCTRFNVTAVAPAGSSYPTATIVPVVAGASYQITVSGTYFANDGLYADAKYSSRFGGTWSDLPQNYEIHGPTLLDLQIWDPITLAYVSPNWGPYESAHTYAILWTARSNALSFRINDFAASNNTGALSVTVCPL